MGVFTTAAATSPPSTPTVRCTGVAQRPSMTQAACDRWMRFERRASNYSPRHAASRPLRADLCNASGNAEGRLLLRGSSHTAIEPAHETSVRLAAVAVLDYPERQQHHTLAVQPGALQIVHEVLDVPAVWLLPVERWAGNAATCHRREE
eukprot:4524540-Prymnesium_polylepis.2